MTNQELSRKILELVGGKTNVITAVNCMTRLRIQLRDSSLADIPALKQTEGVLGVVEDVTLQVILGPGKAKKVCDLFVVDAGVQTQEDSIGSMQTMSTDNDWQSNKAAMKAGQKDNALKQGLRVIANIFVPMIPAVIAAGLFNGFASVMGQIWPEEIASGTGLIYLMNQLFALFEEDDPEKNLEQIVYRSLKFKKKIVEQDERESGLRACLNFGHTIGHGIEAVRGVRGRRTTGLYHGECVALGMLPMIEDPALLKRVRAIYRTLGLPTRTGANKARVLEFMQHDKKTRGDHITVIKCPGLGCWRADNLPTAELPQLLGLE